MALVSKDGDVVAVLIRCVYQQGNIDEDELDELFEIVSRC
jgi:transcription initiation factor IIE alpha subunit